MPLTKNRYFNLTTNNKRMRQKSAVQAEVDWNSGVAIPQNRAFLRMNPSNWAKSTAGVTCALVIFLLFPGSMALGQGSDDTLNDRMKILMFKYTDCVTEWAGKYVDTGATASKIAEGAHSKCQQEFEDYANSSEEYFLSITPTSVYKHVDLTKGRSVASDIRTMTREHIIRLVIEARSEASNELQSNPLR